MLKTAVRLWLIATAAFMLVVLGTTTTGQTSQQPNQDTLGALLVEVRGLRSAIEQMASVGPSIQLAMGRLQLQEQRINTLVRRADGVRDALAAAHKRAGELRDRLGSLQRALEESTDSTHRSAIEGELPIIKQDLARATAENPTASNGGVGGSSAGFQRPGALGGDQSTARRIGSRAHTPLKTPIPPIRAPAAQNGPPTRSASLKRWRY